MRVITFKERFAEPVRSGAKRQTIRKSAGCAAGDILSLRRWTGRPRHSKQELLRTEPCESVCAITVTDDGVSVEGAAVSAQAMAKADGFADFAEMREFFRKTHGLPFSGYLIRWQAPAAAGERPAAAAANTWVQGLATEPGRPVNKRCRRTQAGTNTRGSGRKRTENETDAR